LRETAFLLDISVGACLLDRLKSRRSFRPALRSAASLSSHASPFTWDFVEGFGFLPVLLSVAWAFANAPKDIDAAAASGPSSSEDSD